MSTTTPTTVGTRWAGVGSSADADADAATRAALATATAQGSPTLVLLFVSPWCDLPTVARTAQEVLGDDVVVAGCTTAGEIAGDRAGSGQVVAVALGGDGLTVRSAVAQLGDDPRAAGQHVGQAIVGIDRPHQALMLLCDGFVGARAELVRGVYGVTGAHVPLVGGCAADEMLMKQTFQIHGGEVLTDAVIGIGIGSEGPIALGIGHGFVRTGEPLLVTESDGHRIMTIDDKPAMDIYKDSIDPRAFEPGATTPHEFVSLLHPLGLTRPGGEEIRAVLGLDFEQRSLFCGDVPQGTVISMMTGDAATIAQGTADACEEVLAQLDGVPPVGVVAFDCAVRRAVLGDEGVAEEMRSIGEYFPGVPLGGFYTQGEFARTRGARGVHNATLVLLALA
jgi:hypothetical protein